MEEEEFDSFILKLSPKIIQHISSQMYRSPASGIKELAINSFDSGAKKVEISMTFQDIGNDYKLNQLIVEDDGEGMSPDDLNYVFTNIGQSKKTKVLDFDADDSFNKETKRPTIGRIGIGMLSIASACQQFDIRTKKAGEEEGFRAQISLSNFDKIAMSNTSLSSFNAGTANIFQFKDGANKSKSYTSVEIKTFKKPFMRDLVSDIENSLLVTMTKVEGIENANQETLFTIFTNHISSVPKLEKLSKLDSFIAQMALMLPIEYLSDGPIREKIKRKDGSFYSVSDANNEILKELKNRLSSYDFKVFFTLNLIDKDGRTNTVRLQLFKPILYPTKSDLEQFTPEELNPSVYVLQKDDKIQNELDREVTISIKGYVYHQNRRIWPAEFRGLFYRVFDVGIGSKFMDEMRVYTTNPIVAFQMAAEIFLDQGFQSAVNVDRESLFEGAYSFRYLKAYLDLIFNGKEYKSPVDDGSNKPNEESKTPHSVRREANFEDKLASTFTRDSNESKKPMMDSIKEEANVVHLEKLARRKELKSRYPVLSFLQEQFNVSQESITFRDVDLTMDPQIIKKGSELVVYVPTKKGEQVEIPWKDVIVGIETQIIDLEQRKQIMEYFRTLYEYYLEFP